MEWCSLLSCILRYLTLIQITGLRPKIQSQYIVRKLPIALKRSDDKFNLIDVESGGIFCTVSSSTDKILSVLSQDLSVQIFGDYSTSPPTKSCRDRSSVSNKKAKYLLIDLNAILYGPPNLFELVGLFARKCRIYLQHPRHCDREAPYRNPQCLSLESDGPSLSTSTVKGQLEMDYPNFSDATSNPIDIFLDMGYQEQLSEAAVPCSVGTTMYSHQRKALTFMMDREAGWALDGNSKDIWRAQLNSQGKITYYNNITCQKQTQRPEEFRGGLLIDAPGLGKSLSIIALIAADLDRFGQESKDEFKTLLVVPKSLLQTWKDELQRHLKPSSTLRYCFYYGKARKGLLEDLEQYTLVITTYSVVRVDHKAHLTDQRVEKLHTLHSMKWRRVVLDEAHIARQPSKTFAKSVCALEAQRRWAVTGTPIQNRLTDLYSLFKFLQCSPFCDLDTFNTHIKHHWKARSDPYSVAKLKRLVSCLSIRRPKNTIELPPRQDKVVELELDIEERNFYEQVKNCTLHHIGLADHKVSGDAMFHILRWFNQLRLICNHGLQSKAYATHHAKPLADQLSWTQEAAQSRFNHMDATGFAKCSNPECKQDLSSASSSETDNDHEDEPYIEEGLTVLCSACYSNQIELRSQYLKVCNHFPRRSLGSGVGKYLDVFDVEDHFSIAQSTFDTDHTGQTSTKIKHVMGDLKQHPDNVKRSALLVSSVIRADLVAFSVVFSSWTKTLDILQPLLQSNSIRCVRLDGTSSAANRASVLRVFRDEPGIKVLLATITCGGVGLDLTAASRAYILEPQWNPMSESQALDRIHRLGQVKEVITTRYVMKGTLEEQVVRIQRKKEELADLTLSSGSIDKAELTHGRLQYLKDLVG